MSKNNLHSYVVNALALACMQGRFASAEGLLPREEVLMSQFAVSRTVLREATKTLSAKGLLHARPKTGTRMLPREQWNLLDPDMLRWYAQSVPEEEFARGLHEMREMLEPAAAAMAATRRSSAQLAQLRQAWQAMQQAETTEQWVPADLAFHRQLLRCSGNALLMPLGNLIEGAFLSMLRTLALRAERFNVSLPQHEAILQAVARGNAEQARAAMETLLQSSRARMLPPASSTARPKRKAAAPLAAPPPPPLERAPRPPAARSKANKTKAVAPTSSKKPAPRASSRAATRRALSA